MTQLQIGKAWSRPKRMCNHPELIPTAWNQPKPEPAEMVYHCECGENYSCPVCGWGAAVWPCSCMKARQVEREDHGLRAYYDDISKRYSKAWRVLGKA